MSTKTTKLAAINFDKLKPHPLGSMFPPMSDIEYAGLKKGMKEHGYDKKHPVVLFEGLILDGNHRYTASKATKQKPEFIQFDKLGFDGTPFDYVVQENLQRRNLTPSQAAAIGAELVEQMKLAEKQEKEAEKQAAKEAASRGKQPPKKAKRAKGAKSAKVAKALNVSKRSVDAAAALKAADPAGFEDVKKGSKTLNAATTDVAVKKSAEQRKSEEFANAAAIVDRVLGDGFAAMVEKKLSAKDVVKLSGIDEEEMKRIKPLLEAGWTLKMATGYRSTDLTMAHNIRQLTDRATAQGGNYILLIGEFEITVKRKSDEQAQ